MKKKKKNSNLPYLIPIICALVVLIGGLLLIPDSEPEVTEEPVSTEAGAKAPDFIVYDENGTPKKLSDYYGKPIVLNFWATWCSPCVRELPHFQVRYNEQGDEVQFLMVNLTDGTRETVAGVKAFMEDNSYHFPVLYDTSSNASTAYNVTSIPTTYFINAEGKIVTSATGSLSAEDLQKGIDMITK